MRRTFGIATAAIFVSSSVACAGPVLLESFRQDARVGGGSGPITDLRGPFVLHLPHSPPQGPPVDPLLGVGAGVWWEEGETGVARFDAENDPFFENFELFATDGSDGWIGVYTLWGGYLYRESEFFGVAPDLYGFDIDHVLLHVDYLGFRLYPDLGGSAILYDITFEVFGTVVPEPACVAYLLCGAAVLFGRRHRQYGRWRLGWRPVDRFPSSEYGGTIRS